MKPTATDKPEDKKDMTAEYIYDTCKGHFSREAVIGLIENELRIAHLEGQIEQINKVIWS